MAEKDDDFWSALGRKPEAAPEGQAQPDHDPEFWGSIGKQGSTANPDGPPGQPGQIDPLTGKPFQFMSTANPKSPVVQSMDKPITEGNAPGVGAQMAINTATDPEQRRRIAAHWLFPEMSPVEAESHVFYGPDRRLAAVDKSGHPFFVDPQAPIFDVGRGEYRLGDLPSYVASGVPGAVPGLVGGGAALLTSPGSMLLAPSVAAGGAALADMTRQKIASYLDPRYAELGHYDPVQTMREAAQSGGGQLAGSWLSNQLAPNPLGLTPGERRIIAAPGGLADTTAAYANARTQGIDLTPGQASGLPSLLTYEDAARTMPSSVDRATEFYRTQGQQTQQAGQTMLGGISPQADKNVGASGFQAGAEDAIRGVRERANAAARPSYEAAQQAGQVMSPDLAQLADQPAVQEAMDRARATYRNLYRTEPPDTPDFALWDLTKRQLDDRYNTLSRAGERTDAMAVDTLRGDLRTHLDAAYPTYGQARATAAPGQQLAAQLEDSGVGQVANKTGDERARAILAPVFSQNNPQAITRARDAFIAAGRGDEWNAGVRAYVQDAIDRASVSQEGLNPARLRRDIWSNTDVRENLRAALTPTEFQGFQNFLNAVEDMARTYPQNSLTATRLNARNALMGAGEDQGNVRALKAVQFLMSPQSWLNAGTMLEGVKQRMIAGNAGRILDHLFTPDGLEFLQQMAMYRPGALKAMETATQFFARRVGDADVSKRPPENNYEAFKNALAGP